MRGYKITVRLSTSGRNVVTVDGRRVRKWKTSSRECYYDRESGLVIKVDAPFGDYGYQCADEVAKWKAFTPEQRKLVAPMVAHGAVLNSDDENHRWVAVRYVEGRRPTNDEYQNGKMWKMFEALGLADE